MAAKEANVTLTVDHLQPELAKMVQAAADRYDWTLAGMLRATLVEYAARRVAELEEQVKALEMQRDKAEALAAKAPPA